MTSPVLLGIDGCRGGWMVARLTVAGPVCLRVPLARVGALLDEVRRAPVGVAALDIPIGLPAAGGRRACDAAARRRLPGRASTVYPAPARDVLAATSYAGAREVLSAAGGPSMSAQAWGLVAAVRAVDAVVTPADGDRVVEAHPELAFAAMTGAPLPPKTTPAGAAQRRAALATVWPSVAGLSDQDRDAVDRYDAIACLWVARRRLDGSADELGDGSRDARGLSMRIVC